MTGKNRERVRFEMGPCRRPGACRRSDGFVGRHIVWVIPGQPGIELYPRAGVRSGRLGAPMLFLRLFAE